MIFDDTLYRFDFKTFRNSLCRISISYGHNSDDAPYKDCRFRNVIKNGNKTDNIKTYKIQI